MSNFIDGNIYKQKPENVLGEAYQTSGRFKKVTKYQGTIRDLEKIKVKPIDYSETKITVSQKEEVVKNVQKDAIGISNIRKAIKVSEKEKHSRKNYHTGIDLISFDEIDKLYNAHLDKEEKEVFVWYMRNVLGRKMEGGWKKYHLKGDQQSIPKSWIKKGYLSYDIEEGWLPAFLYYSGNMYEAKDSMLKNKAKIIEKIGTFGYDAQLKKVDAQLEEVKKEWLSLSAEKIEDRLRVLPTSDFVKEQKISLFKGDVPIRGALSTRKDDFGLPDIRKDIKSYNLEDLEDVDLQYAFVIWMKQNAGELVFKKGTDYLQIQELYLWDKKRGKNDDKDEFKKKKTAAKDEGKRLFSKFLKEGLMEEDQRIIEEAWNSKFNSESDIDLNKVPIGFSMARFYAGMEMDIRIEKREAIAFSMIRGTACLAYGVGLGKTWASIFIVAQFLENGWCDRPFFALPNQVYPQFLKEFQGILPHIPTVGLYNLSEAFESKADEVEDGTATFFSYEGLRRLSLEATGESVFFGRLYEILEQVKDGTEDKWTKRDRERFNDKLDGVIGKAQSGAYVSIQKMGLDMMILDEAHSAKKSFTSVKGQTKENLGKRKKSRKDYKITSGTPSAMALKSFMISQFIQSKKKTGNILLLTATPFTNSPLEVYSMLALMAYDYLKANDLNNITNFFDNFTIVQNELVIDASLNPVYKEIFTGFANLPGLQQLIKRFFLYKADAPKLKRPNKIVLPLVEKLVNGNLVEMSDEENVSTILTFFPLQKQMMEEIIAYSEGKYDLIKFAGFDKNKKPIYQCADHDYDDFEETENQMAQAKADGDEDVGAVSEASLDKAEKIAIRLLRAVNFARSLSLSPYLYRCSGLEKPTYKEYIETSAKLSYTMQCIKSVKEWHEKRGEAASSQLIYMNRGVSYFPLIKEYLIKEVGFKEHEVGIIASDTKMKEMKMPNKIEVQNRFLGRRKNPETGEYESIPDDERIKVLIGSATIKEGINLQNESTVLYNLWLDWNPTDVIQLEGRIWRQGNRYLNVRIVNPLMEDSMDIFMFQKLEEKTARINAIWDFKSGVKALDLAEFNPSELKYTLIKDERVIAKLEAQEKILDIRDDASIIRRDIQTLQEFTSVKNSVEYFIERNYKELKKYQKLDDSILSNPVAFKRKWKKAVKDQVILSAGKKISKMDRREKLEANISEYKTNIEYPWGWYTFASNVRKIELLTKTIFEPKGIGQTPEEIKLLIENMNNEVLAKEEEEKELLKDDAIIVRATEIKKEREAKGFRSATIEERVDEFKTLNYLLAERRVEFDKKSTKAPIAPQFTKGSATTLEDRKAKITRVVPRNGMPAMYELTISGIKYLVFENELNGSTKPKPSKVKSADDQAFDLMKKLKIRSNKLIKDFK